jgi:predicted Ser/Thr protein kinase
MTCPTDDALAAIASLPDAERAAIADHAAGCETCRLLVEDLLSVKPAFAEAETAAASGAVPAAVEHIDRYRIERRLGAGAMGVVYAAHDPELARPVAVKVLRAGGSADRMRREAQALAKLTHANVVAVYDVGDHAGQTFVTMALVDGDNLRTWLATPRTTPQIVDAITQAARGVAAAHRAGIVHRDIKPDNIFVARTGEVLVGDFGLARSGERPSLNASAPVGELTEAGALVGTPAYMAPEQVDGDASEASDQFALCVTAWEALYGTRPFTGNTMGELVAAMRAGPPPEPETRKVPSPVRTAIRRGLAADPAARHPSVSALIAALSRRPARWPYVAGAAALAGVAVAAVALLRPDPEQVALARCDALQPPSAWSAPERERVLAKLAPPAAKPAVGTIVAKVVDRYAAEHVQLARTSCTAAARRALSEPVYAATKRCLDRRAATLAWVFSQSLDPFEVLGIVETLEPVETCVAQVAGAPTAALAKLQQEIDRGAAYVHAAPGKAIMLNLDVLVEQAQALGDPGTLAEASYLNGVALQARGRDTTAELRRAISAAEQARDDRIRTRAFALLAVDAANAGRITEAVTHRELATSAAARAQDLLTAWSIERATIAIAFARGDVPAELAALGRLAALVQNQFGERSRSLVDVQFKIAGAMQRANDPGARAMLDRAIAGLAELADAEPQLMLEQAALAERIPARRIVLEEQIIAIARKETPERVPELLAALGIDYELAADYERALATFIEARPLVTKKREPDLVESAANMAF